MHKRFPLFLLTLALIIQGLSVGRVQGGGSDSPKNATRPANHNQKNQKGWEGSVTRHEAEIIKKSPLALKMLEAYRDIETYRAEWRGSEGSILGRTGKRFVVIFDRHGPSVLFLYHEYLEIGEGKNTTGAFFLTTSDEEVVIAKPDVNARGRPAIDVHRQRVPEVFRYAEFRELNRSAWTPWDLALLWSSSPLTDVLGHKVSHVETIEPDEHGRPGLKVAAKEDARDYVILRLNPDTHLVYSKVYVNLSEFDRNQARAISLEAISVNRPLEQKSFKPDTYLSQLEP